MRDAVSAQDYERACEKLIAQFKVLHHSMKHLVRKEHSELRGGGLWACRASFFCPAPVCPAACLTYPHEEPGTHPPCPTNHLKNHLPS